MSKDVHLCHAIGCTTPVPPKLWGCKRHWFMVPKFIRDKVWVHYRPGQENDKDPTSEYVYWSFRAQMAVAEKEGNTDHSRYRQLEAFCNKYEKEHNP